MVSDEVCGGVDRCETRVPTALSQSCGASVATALSVVGTSSHRHIASERLRLGSDPAKRVSLDHPSRPARAASEPARPEADRDRMTRHDPKPKGTEDWRKPDRLPQEAEGTIRAPDLKEQQACARMPLQLGTDSVSAAECCKGVKFFAGTGCRAEGDIEVPLPDPAWGRSRRHKSAVFHDRLMDLEDSGEPFSLTVEASTYVEELGCNGNDIKSEVMQVKYGQSIASVPVDSESS